MYLFKKSIFRSLLISPAASSVELLLPPQRNGIVKSRLMRLVLNSRMFIPAWVNVITVSRLSNGEVFRFTSFLIRAGLQSLAHWVFLYHPAGNFLTQTWSGCLPLSIRSTLYCSWVNPYSFNSLLIMVFNHHAVYKTFRPALCTSVLNLLLFL